MSSGDPQLIFTFSSQTDLSHLKYQHSSAAPLRCRCASEFGQRNINCFPTTCASAAVLLPSRRVAYFHISLAAHVCNEIIRRRPVHHCRAASDSPNATCVRPARVHFDPCSVYSVSSPSPVVLTNNLAARVCGAIVRRHLTIVAAQLADSQNATRVQPARFRQSTLVTTRHPDPSKAAKRYTRNGFSVSATCSRNACKSTEILTCPPLSLPA